MRYAVIETYSLVISFRLAYLFVRFIRVFLSLIPFAFADHLAPTHPYSYTSPFESTYAFV